MGLAEWFKDFCSNIQVQNNNAISIRYKSITRRLNTDFWNTISDTSHSLYVGSYGRNTAIKGFSDLDMVFELPSQLYFQYDGYTGNGQSALLQQVKNSIQKTYSSTNIGGDGQVVVVQFQDGMNRKNLKLDGSELITVIDVEKGLKPLQDVKVEIKYADGTSKTINTTCRIDTDNEVLYYINGGILQYVLRNMLQ